ncbi:hypothetical protein BH10PSE12_BH10PSE12_18340 [soil metagenome]
MILFSVLLAMAQGDKLPPANPVPLDTSAEASVLAPINALFAALGAGDAAAMLQHVYPEGRVSAIGPRRDGAQGLRQESWTKFAERITPGSTFQERIWDPAIDIDGDIAMVWAPYDVRVAGKVANCGVDHFDLIREAGVWKVMNLSFSSRTTGCSGQ